VFPIRNEIEGKLKQPHLIPLYNDLAVLADQNIVGFDERTRFFCYVDLIVQVLGSWAFDICIDSFEHKLFIKLPWWNYVFC
jgi:hypothetical protein